MLVSQMLRRITKGNPLRIALVVDGSEINYASILEESEEVAAGLTRLGLVPGDRMALMLPNSRELILGILAAFRLGLVVVPIPLTFAQAQIGFVLSHTGAKVLFTTPGCLNALSDEQSDRLEHIIFSGNAGHGHICYDDLLGSRRGAPPLSAYDQAALVVFTSGTTGDPKGACHTQASLVARTKVFIETMELGPGDSTLTVFPATRPVVLVSQVLAMLGCGGRIVLYERLEPEEFWTAYSRSKPTYSLLVPAYARRIFTHEMATIADHSRARFWLTGGDQPGLELFRQVSEQTGRPLLNMFGMTETGILAMHPLHGPSKPGSMGKPIKGVRLRVAGPDGREIEAWQTGRLYARSKHMMLGYFNDTLSTHAAFVTGWFDTQDLAKRDSDGYYWFMGRSRELIIRGASKVDSRLVEQSLTAHPSILEARLVGIDDLAEGQIPVAFFKLQPGALIPDTEELVAWMRERVDQVSTPVAYHAIEAWPLTRQDKLDHAALVRIAKAKGNSGQEAIAADRFLEARANDRKAGN